MFWPLVIYERMNLWSSHAHPDTDMDYCLLRFVREQKKGK